MEEETGRDRVKSLFISRPGEPIPEEFKEWSTTVFVASTVGFLFGGMIGARWSGDKYIMMNHFTKYAHPMQAHRELHGAALLGFVRQGSKWGWKIGLFAALFSGCNILLKVYRDKDDGLNIVTCGAVTGSLFRARYGIKPAIGGLVLGTLISIPVGLVYQSLDVLLISREEKEKIRLKKYQERRIREKNWNNKLLMTDSIVDSLEHGLDYGEKGLTDLYTVEKKDNRESFVHRLLKKLKLK